MRAGVHTSTDTDANVRTLQIAEPGNVLDAGLLTALEALLEDARAGKLTAVAFVAKERGWSRRSGWQADTYEDTYNILGQLTALTSDIVHRIPSPDE